MKSFFKMMFASMIGTILALTVGTAILSFIFVGIIAATASFGEPKEHKVKDQSILHLELNEPLPERASNDPFKNFDFSSFQPRKELSIRDAVAAIHRAKDDDKIKGIFMDFSFVPLGRSEKQELRKAILDFKESDKFIYAYGDIYTQGSYSLAALADSIFLQPKGLFEFQGNMMELAFLRGMFDKLDIEPKVIKHGDYKSAGETFDHTEMSDSNREQLSAIMSSVYNHYLVQLSEARGAGLDTATLRGLAAEMKVKTAEDALEHKLVDGLIYRDEMLEMLVSKTDADDIDDLEMVSLSDYNRSPGGKKAISTKDRIAVVYAVGAIGMGEGNDENIGSEGLSAAIREARSDSNVKAVVLRVNSPGGSALASDVILREVELTQKVKPVVVSMGNVAASGGYYISCKAGTILAEPNTITGSIGVIAMMLNTQKFFENKLGVTFDRVKTGPYADLGNPNRPMTAEEEAILQGLIGDVYDDFITHVAEGRNMSKEKVNRIGRGRVWTGEQALKIGLVDKLGGIGDAIELAAEQADIAEYKVRTLPKQKDAFQEMVKEFGASVKEEITISQIGEENYRLLKRVEEVKSYNDIMMIMPLEIY